MNPFSILCAFGAALIFPQSCVLCGCLVWRKRTVPLCRSCEAKLRPLQGRLCVSCGDLLPGLMTLSFGLCLRCRHHPPDFDQACAWGAYGKELRQLIWHFKYAGHPRLSDPLAELMFSASAQRKWPRPDGLIPVPRHPRRVRRRGFDPAYLLARDLASRLEVPLLSVASRIRRTVPQFGLDEEARRRNLESAFWIDRKPHLADSSVWIVDDILTTGTTAGELTRALRRAGARTVNVLVIARAVKHFH